MKQIIKFADTLRGNKIQAGDIFYLSDDCGHTVFSRSPLCYLVYEGKFGYTIDRYVATNDKFVYIQAVAEYDDSTVNNSQYADIRVFDILTSRFLNLVIDFRLYRLVRKLDNENH